MEIKITNIQFSEETKKEIQQKLNAGLSIEEVVDQMDIKINFC
jgi:hypothetical protein